MTNVQEQEGLNLIEAVQRDHREIEAMFSTVEQSSGRERQDAFEDLVRKLAVHETAEEEVVHPLAKRDGAPAVVDEVLNEEDDAKKALADLDGMDVTSPKFDEMFLRLKADVLAHAQNEERNEHPAILEHESDERLERLAGTFVLAEKTAPTRPHAASPESRAGNLALGPILAVTDRVRDAVRDAMKADG
jgi:hemerythrin superfamily protein